MDQICQSPLGQSCDWDQVFWVEAWRRTECVRDRAMETEMWRQSGMIKMHREKIRGCLGAKKGTEEDTMKARGQKQRVTGFLVESPFS